MSGEGLPASSVTRLKSQGQEVGRETEDKALNFIRLWNEAAVRRNGGVVITPHGTLDEETTRLIDIAKAAGRRVFYLRCPPPRQIGKRVSDRSRR